MCPQAQLDALGDVLQDLEALSVSVEDADAQTDAEQALFGEPGMPAPAQGWLRSRVSALFAEPAGARAAFERLQEHDCFAGCELLELVDVPDQDWVRLTQSQFAPVEISAGFWVVPSWHEPPAAATCVIRLDPGLAFGTGTHPTTRMCLQWLAQHPAATRVLDYGCGSGILAIGAAKFGAGSVVAVDIDDAAVAATRQNASENAVSAVAGRPDVAVGQFELVLANILATPLKVLAPLLCAHVAPNGHLVLAGILERQAEELAAAYRPYCRLAVSDQQDGWVLMTARM
jgi:ribosomal protein L11 methyltransferase